jgi:hypothetical protein
MNRRLDQLVKIANGQSFVLAISYAGRDTKNKTLPLGDVGKDLDFFIRTYKGQAAFARFHKPVVIWSSATEYPAADVQKLTASRRDRLTILASAATVKEYQPFAGALDGNAYYWSSVDPEGDSGYEARLTALGQAVHAARGMWIAPAAPGYSSAGNTGGREVERNDGDTLRQEYQTALKSAPDAIGLISWNMFRESTHIEPSAEEGVTALQVVADLRHGLAPKQSDFPASQQASAGARPAVAEFDSSEPGNTQARAAGFATLGAVGLMLVASVGTVVVRSLRRR